MRATSNSVWGVRENPLFSTMDSKLLLYLALCALLLIVISRLFKVPKTGSVVLVTGGVKTGKTTLSVHLALKCYRRAIVRYYISRILFFWRKSEKPLLYSNIPLARSYVPVTRDLLLRNVRPNYKSVILLSEASLVADSQLIRDKVINQKLLEFFKLIGHETRGGSVILDTQSIADLHYSIKRCLSEYLYIHHIVRFVPFFIIAYVREDRYSEDGSVIATYTADVEDTLTRVIIPKRVWKKFDCYCYSAMTDHLPVVSRETMGISRNLKIKDYVSFRDKIHFDEVKK